MRRREDLENDHKLAKFLRDQEIDPGQCEKQDKINIWKKNGKIVIIAVYDGNTYMVFTD